jgi:hypothetical protein
LREKGTLILSNVTRAAALPKGKLSSGSSS